MKQKKSNPQNSENIRESVNESKQLHQSVNQEKSGFKINTKYNYLFVLAIFIAGIIAYSNSFDCSFHFDDNNILNNKVTLVSSSIHDWVHSFPTRPIGILTFALNYKIHKLDVWGYHFINLSIHLINAFLVWWLTWLTLSTPVMKNAEISRHKAMMAFLTGMLFVTHPLATQSVTYIAQRLASLATLFYLLSLILFVQGKLWQGNKNIPWVLYGGSIASAVLGILTKEIVFTLPFAICLYYYCFLKADPWKQEIKNKGFILAFIVFLIFILFIFKNYSLNVFSTVKPDQGYSYSISMKEYFLTQFSVILTYLRLFILPINQNLDYDYQLSTSFFQLKTFFSFSLLLGILATGVLLFRRYRLISFAIFWFFLTMSVESSIIPISQNVIFEHRTYLPGFGFFLAFTSAFFYFIKERYLKYAVVIILMIASINTVLTYKRNKIWKNEYSLWTDCVKKSSNKARANNNLCSALIYKGRPMEGINYCNKAISINPDYATAYSNRALAYDNLGQYQRAIEDYNEAIHLKSDFPLAYFNRGFLYNKLKQHERAIEDYSKAISLYPDYAYAYNNRGSVYFKLDNYQRAIEDYDKAINLQPDFAAAYNNRSSAYLKQGNENLGCIDAQKACAIGDCASLKWAQGKGFCRSENSDIALDWMNKEQALWNGEKYTDPTKAIEYLNNAIKLQQNNASYYSKRGTAYYNLGQYQRAIENYSEAIRLKPDYSLAYFNRGCIYAKNPDQYKRAIEDFNKAIKLKPDYTEAYNNLGGIYLIQGKKSLGCSNAQKACELGKCKLLEMAKGQGYCR